MASFDSARASFPADSDYPSATRHDLLAAGLWANSLSGDHRGFYHPSLPSSSYGPPSVSHASSVGGHGFPLPTMDFASNVPSLWGYQNLLGFLPHPLPAPNSAEPIFDPPHLTSPYVDHRQPHDQPSYPTSNSVSPPNALSAITPSLSGSEHGQYSPFDVMNQKVSEFSGRCQKSSPVFKMFKCTLDPNCEMEFTRAEHLARHERKHTKEKPFQCHCSKSFSRLDNWRQHKVSVHRDQVEENALTEERLVQVHKSMQRQNNIRKVATLAAQRQGHLERSPSQVESLEAPLQPAVSSTEDITRRHSCLGCLGQPDLSPLSPLDQKPRRGSEASPVSTLEHNLHSTDTTPSEPLSRVSDQLPVGSADRSPWSQFGTPPSNYLKRTLSEFSAPYETMPPSNHSPNYPTIIGPMLIPPGSNFEMSTPSNLSWAASSNSEDSCDTVPQFPSRLNYNQFSRLPLSSLWPSSQNSTFAHHLYTSTKLSDQPYHLSEALPDMLHGASPMGCTSQPITRGASSIPKRESDDLLHHHHKFLSPLNNYERHNNVSPCPIGKLNYGLSKYVENQPCYSGFEVGRNLLVEPMLVPGTSYNKKRELGSDMSFEEEMMDRERQRTAVKRMRI